MQSHEALSRTQIEHRDYAVEGLKTLARAHTYIAHDVATAPNGLEVVFAMLIKLPSDSLSFQSAVQLIAVLCDSPEFVSAAVKADPPVTWMMLRALCTISNPKISNVWAAAESFCSHPDGLADLIENGAVPHLLGIIFGVSGYVNTFASRLGSVSLISKFLWNPTRGPDASAMLRRLAICSLFLSIFYMFF
jgi:hypothetical protein